MPLNLKRLMVSLIGLAILASLLKLSLANSLANIHLAQAQNSLPSESVYLPTPAQLENASVKIQEALKLAPNDANNLDMAGRISYLRSFYTGTEAERTTTLLQATKLHEDALRQRQNWPYSYVNLLYAKAAASDMNAEFLEQFMMAYRLGSDDKNVIRDLVYLGVSNWNQLDTLTRELTANLAEIGLQKRILTPRSFKPFLEAQSQLYRLCAHMNQFEEKAQLCNS